MLNGQLPIFFSLSLTHFAFPLLLHLWVYNALLISLRCTVLSRFSCVRLFVTLWTIAHQAPLFMDFSRQEYWGGLSFPSPGDLPTQGSNLRLLYFLH